MIGIGRESPPPRRQPPIVLIQSDHTIAHAMLDFFSEGLEYVRTTGALITLDTWNYKRPQSLDMCVHKPGPFRSSPAQCCHWCFGKPRSLYKITPVTYCMCSPIEWNTTLLQNVSNPTGLHGSKAVGEPPLLMSAALYLLRAQKGRRGSPHGR